MVINNSPIKKARYLRFLVFTLFVVGVFLILHFLGPAISGFLVGPAGVSPNFQNATLPSRPDIVVTNITVPSFSKAGANNTINITLNVTTTNSTATSTGWNVNVTLFQVFSNGPNIANWESSNATTAADIFPARIADIDGNGLPDIVAGIAGGGVNRISLYNSTIPTSFAQWPSSNASVADSPYGLAVGDIDGDGDTDIVAGIAGAGDRISLYNNTGTTLDKWPSSNATTVGRVYAVAVGDMDNDGDNDIVACEQGAAGSDVLAIYNNTGAEFAAWPSANLSLKDDCYSIAIGDIDGDGRNDVVATSTGTAARIIVFNNTAGAALNRWPNGTVQLPTGGTPDEPYAVAIGDIDGDGDSDVAVGIGNNVKKVSLYNNTGANFSKWPSANATTAGEVYAIAINDMDSDGDNDIIAGFAATGTNEISIFNNTGGLNITQWATANVTTADDVYSVALADLDNDGDTDIVAGLGAAGDRISVYNSSDVSTVYLDSQIQTFTNVTNLQGTYFLNWTPAVTATGTTGLIAFADLAGNHSETIENNNFITANSSSINCVSLETVNELQVNNSTTLCTGTYLMNDTNGNGAIQIINSSLTLDCNGATIIGNNRAGNNIGLFVNNSTVTIKGCNFANYTYGALVNLTFDVNFTNNTFFNNTHGIFLNSTNQTTIWNQTMNNNSIAGLFSFNTNNTTIINSTIYNSTFYGIRILAGVNNTIQNNTIYNNTQIGILIENTNNTTLFNNTVSYATVGNLAGIYANFSSSNLTLKRNLVFSNRADGIFINGNPTTCGWNIVQNNTIFNNSEGNGIGLSVCPNSTIQNNTIYNNTVGVFLQYNNYSVLVYENYIYNNSIGINVSNDWNVTIINNTIVGNNGEAGASQTPNKIGILLAQNAWINSSSINITTNNVSGQSVGINNSNAAPNYAHNVTVYDNYFSNSLMNAQDRTAGNMSWNTTKTQRTNIIGNSYIAGNFWSDYSGSDTSGDYLGDTEIPWNVSANITVGGDYAPYTRTTVTPASAGDGKSAKSGAGATGASPAGNVVSEEKPSTTVVFDVGESTALSIAISSPSDSGGGTETHSLKVESIVGGMVTIVITSDPLRLQLPVNIPTYVDVNGDGSNDIIVTVLEILSQTSAKIKIDYIAKAVIKKVALPAPVPEKPAPEIITPPVLPEEVAEAEEKAIAEMPEETKSLLLSVILVFVAAVIALVIAQYWTTQKKYRAAFYREKQKKHSR